MARSRGINMLKSMPLAFVVILYLGCSTKAQKDTLRSNSQSKETIENKINLAYSSFANGYKTLDAEMIANSYTKDGLLINVYKDTEPVSFKGRKNIQRFFDETFLRAKKEQISLKITFKVSNRQVLDQSILDNGHYKLEITGPDQTISERYGKFSIVLQQEFGEWKFSVDTNASSTKKEFQEAESI